MKDIKKQIKQYYQNITEIFDQEDNTPKLLHKKHKFKKKDNQELITGIIIVTLILLILISTIYYFTIFKPQQEELNNIKQEKINTLNTLLPTDEEHNKEAIIAQIQSTNTIEELNQINIEQIAYPLLKNQLITQIQDKKDKYNRIEIQTENASDIMNTEDATNYINSQDATTLSHMMIKMIDSVIIPISINRKQAASGFITEQDKVDIYKNNPSTQQEYLDENITENNTIDNTSTKIVGGSTVVSLLRSKDSGNVEESIELSETPKNRNLTQSSTLDIQEILSSRAAGTYDENQIKILLDDYGIRLSNYERTSKIGDLDVEYIIMLEVPRDSVEPLIENMDNIILTIPTYDAPSWVKL